VITTHWIRTREEKVLQIYGPIGTARFGERQIQALEDDIGYRIEHHDPLTKGPQVEVTELEPGDAFSIGDVNITTAATMHAPVRPTIGFRLEHDETSAARRRALRRRRDHRRRPHHHHYLRSRSTHG
jgi:ribonuclease Z